MNCKHCSMEITHKKKHVKNYHPELFNQQRENIAQ